MLRKVVYVACGLVGLLIACAVAALLLLDRFDLGAFAARRITAELGRPVAIAGLHITPGRWVKIDLAGVRLENLPGGTRPAMAEMTHLTAEIEAMSLLHRPINVRQLSVDGLSLLLERIDGRIANWRFGPPKPKPSGPADRSWFPTLRDAKMHRSEMVFRTSSGALLRTRLDDVAIEAEAADRPMRLTIAGAYNDNPVRLLGDLQSAAVLRDASIPFGAELHLASGDTTLEFKGTMTEPLDVDGADGTLTLDAPTPTAMLGFAGTTTALEISLRLTGQLHRAGDLWQLANATGALKDNPITAATLRLVEGTRSAADPTRVGPDGVSADIAFDQLDLNGLFREKNGSEEPDADFPLAVDRASTTLIDARLSAREFSYGKLKGADARIDAALTPGRIAVKDLAMVYLGRIRAAGQIEAAEKGGRITADVSVTGAELAQLRLALGFGAIPMTGKLDAQVSASAAAETLNAATRVANISAAVSMAGGSIAREVIEMASTDIRMLFRTPRGMTPVSCLLGVLEMRGGVGVVRPLRVRAATATIAGVAQVDLNRRQFDLTIGSEFEIDRALRARRSHPRLRPIRQPDGAPGAVVGDGPGDACGH